MLSDPIVDLLAPARIQIPAFPGLRSATIVGTSVRTQCAADIAINLADYRCPRRPDLPVRASCILVHARCRETGQEARRGHGAAVTSFAAITTRSTPVGALGANPHSPLYAPDPSANSCRGWSYAGGVIGGASWPVLTEAMQSTGCELRRTILPRTRVTRP
jgi:hypothetical protein